MDKEKVLNNIKIDFKESTNQENTFTICHTRFTCKLKYNDKSYKFDYECNLDFTKPNKLDLLGAIFTDSESYSSCIISNDDLENMQEFAIEFGYDTKQLKKLIEAFKGCKRAYNRLHEVFTDNEYSLILDYLTEKELI